MFEDLRESAVKSEKKITPKFKFIFLISIILSGLGTIFLYSVMEPLFYILYGYDPNIIETYDVAAFQAVKETYPARLAAFCIVAGISFLCFILSFVAMRRRTYLNSYLITLVIFIFSALLSLFYIFVWLLMLTMPSGILGFIV